MVVKQLAGETMRVRHGADVAHVLPIEADKSFWEIATLQDSSLASADPVTCNLCCRAK